VVVVEQVQATVAPRYSLVHLDLLLGELGEGLHVLLQAGFQTTHVHAHQVEPRLLAAQVVEGVLVEQVLQKLVVDHRVAVLVEEVVVLLEAVEVELNHFLPQVPLASGPRSSRCGPLVGGCPR